MFKPLEKPASLNSFEDVRKFLSNVPNINYGGCAVAALAMYKWLKIHEPEELVMLVYLHRGFDEYSYINNQQVLRTKNGKAKSCCHACIVYKNQYIDCEKEIYIQDYAFVQHIKDEELWLVQNSLNRIHEWNYVFDRKYIGCIEKHLNLNLDIHDDAEDH